MAEISAKEVMALRQKTGLSMMECKKALQETGGDAAAAEDFLRKKLKGKMETRTDRAAGEGRVVIAVASDKSAAVIVEIRAETDFTAKNENFGATAEKIAQLALKQPAGVVTPTDEMKNLLEDLKITTGENLSIARVEKLEGSGATWGNYIHHDGKTAVLLHADASVSEAVARDVCMHITAAMPRPVGVTAKDIPSDVVERERKLALEMARDSGKPEEILVKMVDGKINKLISDLALVEQPFVKEPEKKIRDIVGGDGKIHAFRRWQIGETG
ncbi:MAG: translation elongation factor Ts [Phycisphaeraceae bacterium]|nr:MAG: translation elongation factor Ts [Phycisphaeraceae bacterium]